MGQSLSVHIRGEEDRASKSLSPRSIAESEIDSRVSSVISLRSKPANEVNDGAMVFRRCSNL